MGWLNRILNGTDAHEETYEERLARLAAEALATQSTQSGAGRSGAQSPMVDKPVTNGVAAQEVNPYIQANGQKVVPKVSIERVESHLADEMRRIEVWVHVKNLSDFEVELTRVNFWRQHTNPGRFLKPDESHEIRIYAGETRHDDAEHKAELQYKVIQTGDYFQADHHIEYQYERDENREFYIPEDMHLIEPIRDI